MHYHTTGAGQDRSVVAGEMNNFRTGTQLRTRTSRVPSSRLAFRTHTHSRERERLPPWQSGRGPTATNTNVTKEPRILVPTLVFLFVLLFLFCLLSASAPLPFLDLPPVHALDAPQSCYHLYSTAGNYFGLHSYASGVPRTSNVSTCFHSNNSNPTDSQSIAALFSPLPSPLEKPVFDSCFFFLADITPSAGSFILISRECLLISLIKFPTCKFYFMS